MAGSEPPHDIDEVGAELAATAVRLSAMCAELVSELSLVIEELAELELARPEPAAAELAQNLAEARRTTAEVVALNRKVMQRAQELLAHSGVVITRIRAAREHSAAGDRPDRAPRRGSAGTFKPR